MSKRVVISSDGVDIVDYQRYEAVKNPYTGYWHVEFFDPEGRCLMAVFSGPAAEQRAREYCDWLNSAEFAA